MQSDINKIIKQKKKFFYKIKKFITQEAIEKLMNYKWPGNVRELENVIRRLVTLNPEETINGNSVDEHLSSTVITPNSNVVGSLSASVEKNLSNYFDLHKNSLPPTGLYNRVIHEIERPLILKTLDLTNGNQIKAAELLGINRNTLRKKIKELQIKTLKNDTKPCSPFFSSRWGIIGADQDLPLS